MNQPPEHVKEKLLLFFLEKSIPRRLKELEEQNNDNRNATIAN